MLITHQLIKFFRTFLFTPRDARPLSVLRIGVAFILLYQAYTFRDYTDQLFGRYGVLQTHIIQAMLGGKASLVHKFLAWIPLDPQEYLALLHGLGVVYIAALFLLLVGCFTRFAVIVVWILHVLIINSGYLSIYGVDKYLHVFLFYMMFMPIDRHWAVDAIQKKIIDTPHWKTGFAIRILQVQLALTYANAGISKMFGHDWWNGEAIWRAVNMPEFSQMEMTWLTSVPIFAIVLGWGTLFVETAYPILAFCKKTKNIMIASIVSMHVGIALFMGLHLFATTLILFNLVLFTPLGDINFAQFSNRLRYRRNHPVCSQP